jgi:hypothetical protein
MFEREAFAAVAPLGERVVMRKVIRLSRASTKAADEALCRADALFVSLDIEQ